MARRGEAGAMAAGWSTWGCRRPAGRRGAGALAALAGAVAAVGWWWASAKAGPPRPGVARG
jgi:hypothetical protein